MDKRFSVFLSIVAMLLRVFAIGVAMLMLSRLVFMFIYGDGDELSLLWKDVLTAFRIGVIFDIKVLSFGLLPLYLLALSQLVKQAVIQQEKIRKIVSGYSLFLLSLYAIISVIDFNFFRFFNTRISVLMFGVIEDNTTAVLKSVWTEYPVVWISIALVIFCYILHKLIVGQLKKMDGELTVKNNAMKVGLVLLFTGLYFLGLRGSISMAPLDVRHTTISSSSFVNALTLNGVFALKTAYTDKQRSEINTDIQAMLSRYGFDSVSPALESYLGKKMSGKDSLARNLITETGKNEFLDKNPPNVVFIIMESMNGYYLDLHSRESNLLGQLEQELPDCYVFRNFLSSGELTIFSLEGLLAGTPLAPISQSVYQNRILTSSVALPYKERGYQTAFVSGGEMGWRNLDKFVANQGFDSIEGKTVLEKYYPGAATCEWGVHDEYTFRRIYEILSSEKSSRPRFVVGFTISNHSPYQTPESYKSYPLSLSKQMKSGLKVPAEIARKNFLAYQYANDCLGRFIRQIRNSPLGENTIIAVTGDHANHLLYDFTDRDNLKNFSIPFILYVPEKYKPEGKRDTKVFASHKDVFPTLFNLSLSQAKYVKTGEDLFSPQAKDNFAIYNYSIAMNSAGCVDFRKSPLFFRWENKESERLVAADQSKDKNIDMLYLKSRAYVASMSYYIMDELNSRKIGE